LYIRSPSGSKGPPWFRVWVWGVGCRVQGAGCGLQGAGCRVQGAGGRGQVAGFRAKDSGCRVQSGSGVRVGGGNRRTVLDFWRLGSGFWLEVVGSRVGGGTRQALESWPELQP
jgi:hypothetical protein